VGLVIRKHQSLLLLRRFLVTRAIQKLGTGKVIRLLAMLKLHSSCLAQKPNTDSTNNEKQE
jgi:hypothetical protein